MACEATVTDLSAYRVRRAYEAGWNRAHELSGGERTHIDLCGIEALNPYAAEPERSHWNDGFTKATSL